MAGKKNTKSNKQVSSEGTEFNMEHDMEYWENKMEKYKDSPSLIVRLKKQEKQTRLLHAINKELENKKQQS